MDAKKDRIRIKICGLRRPEWAQAAADAGADFIGLVFAKSPRQVTVEEAEEVLSALPKRVTAVGLFVDEPVDEIRRTVEKLGLKAVQLHGSEPPEVVAKLKGLFVIKAFRLATAEDVAEARRYLKRCESFRARPDVCLVDARVAGGPVGGTGERIPPDVAAEARAALSPMLLAGGLGPDNVAEAIRLVRPWGVDVSSGVESAPGVKVPRLIRDFVRAVRNVEQELRKA